MRLDGIDRLVPHVARCARRALAVAAAAAAVVLGGGRGALAAPDETGGARAPVAGSSGGGGSSAPGAPGAAGPSADAPPASAPRAMKLHEAVRRGLVRARGRSPQGYQKVTLELTSLSKEPLAIDIAGSHLVPSGGPNCQRLGLGPVTPGDVPKTRKSGSGSVVIDLAPGADSELTVNTCCLDSGRPSPGGSNTFTASGDTLPQVRVGVLRWWADNPSAPQYAVNSAIWRMAPSVDFDPAAAAAGTPQRRPTPSGRSCASYAGTYYRLVDGELTAVDPEGIVRILGAEVFSVIPTERGVYAVALGEDRKPKLWLIPMTAEDGWKKVLDLPDMATVTDVIPATRTHLVLVTDTAVSWCDTERNSVKRLLTEKPEFLSVGRAGADRLRVTLRTPARPPVWVQGEKKFEAAAHSDLWTVDLSNGKTECEEQFWNIDTMLCGDGGVFALSHVQRRLERLQGGKFADTRSEAEHRRIVAVARDVVWLEDAAGLLVAADARTGAPRFRTELAAESAKTFDVDPVTGDFAYVDGAAFRRVRGKDGVAETIDPR